MNQSYINMNKRQSSSSSTTTTTTTTTHPSSMCDENYFGKTSCITSSSYSKSLLKVNEYLERT